MKSLAIVADDLTGAHAIGARFARLGFRVVSTRYVPQQQIEIDSKDPIDILVVNTETRYESSESAYEIVREVVNAIVHAGFRWVFKQNDSTLVGNIGIEIKAAMDGMNVSKTVYAPACPDQNRITMDGLHLVDGVQIGTQRVTELIQRQSGLNIDHLNMETIQKGQASIEQQLHLTNTQIMVCDATTSENLQSILGAAINQKISLICGSVGLSEVLAIEMERQRKKRYRYMVIAGSYQDQTKKQIEFLTKNPHFSLIELDVDITNIEEMRREVVNLIYSGQNVVIVPSKKPSENFERDRAILLKFFVTLVKGVLEEGKISIGGLILTGGDTASNIIYEGLKIKVMSIMGEVFPAATHVITCDGPFKGLHLITKSGKWGKPEGLAECVTYLERVHINRV